MLRTLFFLTTLLLLLLLLPCSANPPSLYKITYLQQVKLITPEPSHINISSPPPPAPLIGCIVASNILLCSCCIPLNAAIISFYWSQHSKLVGAAPSQSYYCFCCSVAKLMPVLLLCKVIIARVAPSQSYYHMLTLPRFLCCSSLPPSMTSWWEWAWHSRPSASW